MKKTLQALIISMVLLIPVHGGCATLAGLTCQFEFVMEKRFPCAGTQTIDGDGIARFAVSLGEISRKKTKRDIFRVTSSQNQPAVFTDDQSYPGYPVCSAAVNKTKSGTVTVKRYRKNFKIHDWSGTILIQRPLKTRTAATMAHVFGYSGGSSIPQKANGICAR